MFKPNPQNTSWSPVAKWYSGIVGEGGHYFHEHVILPRLKSLLDPRGGESVLDVGCGQGVYARTLPHNVDYTGIDISKELIVEAKKLTKNSRQVYYVADVTKGPESGCDQVEVSPGPGTAGSKSCSNRSRPPSAVHTCGGAAGPQPAAWCP